MKMSLSNNDKANLKAIGAHIHSHDEEFDSEAI